MTDKPAKRDICPKCGLPQNLCCCDEVKEEQKRIREEHESETFSTSAGKMYDCPLAPGSACNQRPIMCDKGKYDIHCFTHVLRCIGMNIQASHECLRKAGMEHSLLWLFDHDYIRPKYEKFSVSDIVDKIIKDEEYRKNNIDR